MSITALVQDQQMNNSQLSCWCGNLGVCVLRHLSLFLMMMCFFSLLFFREMKSVQKLRDIKHISNVATKFSWFCLHLNGIFFPQSKYIMNERLVTKHHIRQKKKIKRVTAHDLFVRQMMWLIQWFRLNIHLNNEIRAILFDCLIFQF